MFCPNCGNEVNESAKFCMTCGAKMISIQPSIQMVAAKCTNCGGAINVNPSAKTGICPYCNYKFFIEQAINNNYYNVNGNMNVAHANINMGPSADNLALRGLEAEKNGDKERAIDYYNRALDIDINCSIAKEGMYRFKYEDAEKICKKAKVLLRQDPLSAYDICRDGLRRFPEYPSLKTLMSDIETIISNEMHYESTVSGIWGTVVGRLELKGSQLIYTDKKKGTKVYECYKIRNPHAVESMMYKGESLGRGKPNCIQFMYNGEVVLYCTHDAKRLADILIRM